MGGTGVIDNFLGTFTQYIDSGFGLVQGDVRWLAGVLIAIDITLAGLFWAMAPDEDVLARLIKKTLYIGVFAFIIGNYNNLAQIIYNSFAGLGIEAGGGTHERRAASSARQDRRGRHRRRQADPDRDLRHDGFHQRLREPGADHHPARRLADRRHQLLRDGDPALRQPDRVQADDARRLCPRPLRTLRPHRVSRRARARQRGVVRHQDPGARRHHRHRLDDLQSVHQRLQQSADDLRRADTDPRGAFAARSHDLRPWHRQRPDRRRTATRRRRRGRHGSRGGGHRRGRHRRHGRRPCRRGRRDRRHGACGRVRRGRRDGRLSRGRRGRCRPGSRIRRDEPASPRGSQPERELRIRRARRDARERAGWRRRGGILRRLRTARRLGRSA